MTGWIGCDQSGRNQIFQSSSPATAPTKLIQSSASNLAPTITSEGLRPGSCSHGHAPYCDDGSCGGPRKFVIRKEAAIDSMAGGSSLTAEGSETPMEHQF